MSTNEPYSKEVIDAKFETSEERVTNSVNRLVSEVREGFIRIDKDIVWLSRITMGVGVLLLSILVAGAIKWMFH